jgi:hypothetical protein
LALIMVKKLGWGAYNMHQEDNKSFLDIICKLHHFYLFIFTKHSQVICDFQHIIIIFSSSNFPFSCMLRQTFNVAVT